MISRAASSTACSSRVSFTYQLSSCRPIISDRRCQAESDRLGRPYDHRDRQNGAKASSLARREFLAMLRLSLLTLVAAAVGSLLLFGSSERSPVQASQG